jgi:ribonuclease P protein component
MSKILSLKTSADFKRVSKKDQKFYAKTIILLTAPTPQSFLFDPLKQKNAKDFCRLGLTVSKTVGNAVVRNRAKRQLREAFRELISFAKNHRDYIIIARKEIAGSNFEKIISDLKFCITRIDTATQSKTSAKYVDRNKTKTQ